MSENTQQVQHMAAKSYDNKAGPNLNMNSGGGTEKSPLLKYRYPNNDPTNELKWDPTKRRYSRYVLYLLLAAAGAALVIGLVVSITVYEVDEDQLQKEEVASGVVIERDAGPGSLTQRYDHAAVATDAGQCSSIATEVMHKKNGSVVDAAIAALLCLGIHNAHSMGIGGGHFMMIYDRPRNGLKRQMYSIDARETAPAGASVNMFSTASSFLGGLAVGVPGEIRGMHMAWSEFGRLKWSELFEPVLRMCREGYRVGGALANAIQEQQSGIRKNKMLSAQYLKADGSVYEEGDMMTLPQLANTLQIIAEQGPQVFYTGPLADDIVSDIQQCGGIITKTDLHSYTAIWRPPSASTLKSGYTVNTMPAPASGPAMQYMLNILDGYDMTGADLNGTIERKTLAYHRIVEAFKFGYAQRSYLADPQFVNISKFVSDLTSPYYADKTRGYIDDAKTHDPEYYHPANSALPKSAGTSHMSIVGPDGQAVAVTSTINTYFGSKCRGALTGIIFNNEMDDFNKPGDKSYTGYTSASNNFVEPGKRPLSSMVPTIILDTLGEPVYVLGGSGGLLITSAVTYVATHSMWLGYKLHEAIDQPRLHHKLLPNTLEYEDIFDLAVLEGLKKKGHVVKHKSTLAVIQGVYSCRRSCAYPGIYATSDWRKGGQPDGY